MDLIFNHFDYNVFDCITKMRLHLKILLIEEINLDFTIKILRMRIGLKPWVKKSE